MPIATIHGDQLRDKSIDSEKLNVEDNTIPQSAIIGLSEAWDEVYAVLGTDHEGNGIVLTTDINPFVNILETRQVFVKGTAQSLLDTLGIPFIHVYLDDTLAAQITPYQFSSGYYLNIPSGAVVGQKIKLSIVAIDSLSRKSHPRDLWISIVDRELEKPTINYLYKRMSATYPGIDFFKDLYFQVSNLDSQGLKDIFGVLDPILAAVYVELYWDKNDISTIFYKGQCYDGTDTVVKNILASLQNNAVFYARVQLKEKTSNIYSPWSNFQKFQYIVKTDTQCSTVYTASKADTISKTSMYAIDAYGPGSGCVINGVYAGKKCVSMGGCHAYKNAIKLSSGDVINVVIGSGGVSYQSEIFVNSTTTVGTNTTVNITGSSPFSMIAHSGDGWRYSSGIAPHRVSENFVPTNYEFWKGIPSTDGVSGGRDGFLYHPAVDGDRGSLNDCGAGGAIRIGRGNTAPTNDFGTTGDGGGYITNGTPVVLVPQTSSSYYNGGNGAPWGGGGGSTSRDWWNYNGYTGSYGGMNGTCGKSAGASYLNGGNKNGQPLNPQTQNYAGSGLVILVDLTVDEITETV